MEAFLKEQTHSFKAIEHTFKDIAILTFKADKIVIHTSIAAAFKVASLVTTPSSCQVAAFRVNRTFVATQVQLLIKGSIVPYVVAFLWPLCSSLVVNKPQVTTVDNTFTAASSMVTASFMPIRIKAQTSCYY